MVSLSSPVAKYLTLSLFLLPVVSGADVVFEEDFDDQPDWTSTMHSTDQSQKVTLGHTLPEGWDGIYQGTQWSPETGHPDKHASLEILAANSDKALGGEGKSAVFWRESYSLGWKNWASDAHFIKTLDQDYEELYVEFYIRFSENWLQRNPEMDDSWTSKLFRIGHWNREGNYWNSRDGNINPRMFWDYKVDSYGVRNLLAFRHGPPGSNERMPQNGSYNYSSHIEGMAADGRDPQLYDQSNYPGSSGALLTNMSGTLTHEQVFGPSEKWTKIAFYVKMNSKPGVADGIFRQWMDGERIVNFTNMEWVTDENNPENKMVGWNYFAIGGNDYFQPYPNEERFEDWYAIDDLVVATEPPKDMASSADNAPNPPSNISISD